jgi:hypothetical protein
MRYADLPENVLNSVIDEDGWPNETLLRDEIDNALEFSQDDSVLNYEYELDEDNKIKKFKMWTKKFAFVLVGSVFGGSILIGLPRNPPKEG